MFTGIIETIGKIIKIEAAQDNINFTIESSITHELKIDQSLAHNGVCLTVVGINQEQYVVTAVKETLDKTVLRTWKINDYVNLERALKVGDRLDGHFVQGHVDEIGICKNISNENGSWKFDFEYNQTSKNMNIEKGSIAINGVSLTVFNVIENTFSVAIIPYTYENTNFSQLKLGDSVNLEFDVIGKYIVQKTR
ncbi:MAG: riboflavin synthase [Flavobacterium sp.]